MDENLVGLSTVIFAIIQQILLSLYKVWPSYVCMSTTLSRQPHKKMKLMMSRQLSTTFTTNGYLRIIILHVQDWSTITIKSNVLSSQISKQSGAHILKKNF